MCQDAKCLNFEFGDIVPVDLTLFHVSKPKRRIESIRQVVYIDDSE